MSDQRRPLARAEDSLFVIEVVIPKWPKELEAMHVADLEKSRAAEAQRRHANPLLARAQEAERPRRKAVIRVNGELISGGDESSPL